MADVSAGDWLLFHNAPEYVDSYPTSAFAKENALSLGGTIMFAHPWGITTKDNIALNLVTLANEKIGKPDYFRPEQVTMRSYATRLDTPTIAMKAFDLRNK